MRTIATQELLRQLRTLPGIIPVMPRREVAPFSALEGGIARGSLVEFFGKPGCGKTELVLRFLAENPDLKGAWVEQNFSIYPPAFPQFQVELDRILFVEATPNPRATRAGSKAALWATHQILKSQLFGAIVLTEVSIHETELRRLQLASEKSQSIIFLLKDNPTQRRHWPIAIQAEVIRGEEGKIHILKSKGIRPCPPPDASYVSA